MPIKTAIAGRFSPQEWDRLRSVRGVELIDLSDWGGFSPPAPPGSDQYQTLLARLPDRLAGVEAILLMGPARPVLDHAPDLRWIQLPWAGLDQILSIGVFERGIAVTNTKGLNARLVAEWGLAAILSLAKNLPRYVRQQQGRTWERHLPQSLADQTVGIVGMGTIGTELGRMAAALGMRVVGTRRTPPATPPPGVDWLGGPDQLGQLLAEADFVVLAAPNTPETRRLIGASEIAAMKPTAYLVNLARGALVDEAALAGALRDRLIAGAALDVFETEPLPTASPLWELDNVLLTPHVSGMDDRHAENVLALFIENLERYVAGQPLRNLCDPEKGY
ncbi:MAG: D-2-hydroxyacid dehydrogenase [Dehalococcoidia bacterium]